MTWAKMYDCNDPPYIPDVLGIDKLVDWTHCW